MPTGTNTSFAVQAGAPTTLRRSRSMTAASDGPGYMVGHGSFWPVLPSVLFVPIFVVGLLGGVSLVLQLTYYFVCSSLYFDSVLFDRFRFFSRAGHLGLRNPSFPRMRNPTSGASPLWPAAEHPSNPCSPLTMRVSPIDAAALVLDHAWDARVTERLSPWAGLPGFGVALFLPAGSFLASDR